MKEWLVCNLAYGFGSWGDEMILDGALNRLGRENCVVFSHDPDETRRLHSVEALGMGENLAGARLYVGGGGWGYGATAVQVANVIRSVPPQVTVTVAAAGLRPEVDWDALADAFGRVEHFTVRDPTSAEVVRRHFGREVEIVPDLAAHMSVTPVELPPGNWVGVNVVNQIEPVARLLPLLRAFLRRGFRLVALPTITHKVAWHLDGHAACRGVAALLGEPVLDLPGPWYGDSLGPRELAGVAASCRYVIAMRKHGAFVAQRVGVPVLLVDWYADHGLPHRLGQVREVMPRALYCDLHNGDDPLEVAGQWLQESERGAA